MNLNKPMIICCIFLLSLSVFSSGAYMNLGDLDIDSGDEIDCTLDENKDHEDCEK